MINHRHTKGLVLDLNSEVCPDSYLLRSTIGERSDIYRSTVVDSWVDTSKSVSSLVENSKVSNSEVISSALEGATVDDSKLYNASILYSSLEGVQARGSFIFGCTITADVQVGQAELVNLTIDRPMRIGTGYWERVPRSFEVVSPDWNFVVTESTDGHAYVGCQRKPMRTWIKGKERYRKVMGWDHETVDLIVSNFTEWLEDYAVTT